MEARDIVWRVTVTGSADLRPHREAMGEATYDEVRTAFKELIVGYINASAQCDKKQGRTISPMGGDGRGGKILKVRFGLPGRGRSGGLRVCVVADCDSKTISIAGAWERIDDPPDAAFIEAAASD